MFETHSQATKNCIITEINAYRLKSEQRILWPDHQISHYLPIAASCSELLRYCSMTNLIQVTVLKIEQDYLELHKGDLLANYTHIWVKELPNVFTIFLSQRPIAVDQLTRIGSGWSMKIYQLSQDAHIWGLSLKPFDSSDSEYRIITPKYVKKAKTTFYINFDDEGQRYESLQVLGRKCSPAYGKFYSQQELPEGIFSLYQMMMKPCTSFLDNFSGEGEYQEKSYEQGKQNGLCNSKSSWSCSQTFKPLNSSFRFKSFLEEHHRKQISHKNKKIHISNDQKRNQSNLSSKRMKFTIYIMQSGIIKMEQFSAQKKKQQTLQNIKQNAIKGLNAKKEKLVYQIFQKERKQQENKNKTKELTSSSYKKLSFNEKNQIVVQMEKNNLFTINEKTAQIWGLTKKIEDSKIIKIPGMKFHLATDPLKTQIQILIKILEEGEIQHLFSVTSSSLFVLCHISFQLGLISLCVIILEKALTKNIDVTLWLDFYDLLSEVKQLKMMLFNYFENKAYKIIKTQDYLDLDCEDFFRNPQYTQILVDSLFLEKSLHGKIAIIGTLISESEEGCVVDFLDKNYQNISKLQIEQYRCCKKMKNLLSTNNTEAICVQKPQFSELFEKIQKSDYQSLQIHECCLSHQTSLEEYLYTFKIQDNIEIFVLFPVFNFKGLKLRILAQSDVRDEKIHIFIQFLGETEEYHKIQENKSRFFSIQLFVNEWVGIQITGPIEAKGLVKLGSLSKASDKQNNVQLKLRYRFDQVYSIILHSLSVVLESIFSIGKGLRKSLNILQKGIRKGHQDQEQIKFQSELIFASDQLFQEQFLLNVDCLEHDEKSNCEICSYKGLMIMKERLWRIFQMNERLLKIVLSSNYLKIAAEPILLLFAVFYYQIALKKIKLQEDASEEDHSQKLTGVLFKYLRYSYIPSTLIFKLCQSRPFLTDLPQFKTFFSKIYLNTTIGRQISQKQLNDQPRIVTTQYMSPFDPISLQKVNKLAICQEILRHKNEQ